MKDYFELKKNLKKDFSALHQVRAAVLGDSATQYLALALRAMGYENGFDVQIWEADYNQIELQVFNTSSELYTYKPEIVIIFQSTHKLLSAFNMQSLELQASFATQRMAGIEKICDTIKKNISAKIIYYNFYEINDAVFGNYACKTPAAFIFQLRKLNYELMVLASKRTDMFLCDISGIQNKFGRDILFQPSLYISSDIVLTFNVLPAIASQTIDIIATLKGKLKKCVVFDLDNTIWGGIVGDDGMENIQIGGLGIGKAFTDFQYWLKKLKNRGIILAVCSKNTEVVAKEVFEKHPDMVLKLDDIAVFMANWNNKADNIVNIQRILNIGFDSMVFIDDSPFERSMVKEHIPEIYVPEMPEDPANYLEFLYALNLFETASYSELDIERTKLYQTEFKREAEQQFFANENEFLKSLNMQATVEPFNTYNIPRASQLTQRSNQFNLRSIRYSVAEIEKLATSENHFTFAFSLIDKFGDYGLISVIILTKESSNILFVDTWLMSCRVLKRTMENFVLNTLVAFAKENGFAYIKGAYIPSLKNEMVKTHYFDLGFQKENNFWILNTNTYTEKITYCSRKMQ